MPTFINNGVSKEITDDELGTLLSSIPSIFNVKEFVDNHVIAMLNDLALSYDYLSIDSVASYTLTINKWQDEAIQINRYKIRTWERVDAYLADTSVCSVQDFINSLPPFVLIS